MNIDYNKTSLTGWKGEAKGIVLAAPAIQDLVPAGYALAAEFVPKLLLPLLFPIIPSNKHLIPLVVNKELSSYTITFTITALPFVKMAHEVQISRWNLLSESFTRSIEEQKASQGPQRKRRNLVGESYNFLIDSYFGEHQRSIHLC